MAQYIEDILPPIQSAGLNTAVNAHFYGNLTVDGTTNIAAVSLTNLTTTGNTILGNATSDTTVITGETTITSVSASALAVGANGATNPVIEIDASTASVATGLSVKGAAAAGGIALSAISSGTSENLTLDAKGTGTITLNGTATGGVVSGQNFSIASGAVLKLLDNGTATATAGAATLAKSTGVITSESLTTAAGATYTLTVTDTQIAASDVVFASVKLGTATTGMPVVTTVTPAAGSLVIIVQNIHASAAFNGTIVISFSAIKTA